MRVVVATLAIALAGVGRIALASAPEPIDDWQWLFIEDTVALIAPPSDAIRDSVLTQPQLIEQAQALGWAVLSPMGCIHLLGKSQARGGNARLLGVLDGGHDAVYNVLPQVFGFFDKHKRREDGSAHAR